MSVRGKALSVDSVLAILGTRTEFSNTSLRPKALQTQLDKIAEELTFGAKADLLVKQDPEFASLIEEYRQGILLYQEEQENVWNKVAINDSVLTAFFEAHRDQFTWPDRVALTVVRASNDSLAQAIHRMLLSATTIEQVAAEDSVRMAMPATRALKFGRGSSNLDKAARQDLALLAAEIKKNLSERITLTSHPDTNAARVKNLKLAQTRLEAVKAYLTKTLKAEPSHISLVTAPLPRGAKDSISAARANTVDAYLGGRSALVFGKVESLLLPTTTDERTRNADSLSVGGISEPFRYSAVPTIVRLDGREKARQKTFEEASGEVSGAYQEAESKQLESDWLARLRRTYPVIENGKALQDAFAPLQK
jgi:peptidyl-prolyl cis-trans isomerase SurA